MTAKYLSLVACLLATNAIADHTLATKYSTVENFMNKLEQDHPDQVKGVVIGIANSGEKIKGVAIGTGDIHNLVVGTHHGNEYGSTEVGMAFAKSLAEHPIPGQTVYVVPVLNIEGYNANQREETDAQGKSRDPNRDYPGPCASEGPYHLKSTAALSKFIDHENIINTATLHTYYPAVVYPWGISTHDVTPPNEETFKTMAKNATIVSKYETGTSTEVIYPADGTYEDYAFWKTGAWSLLFELGISHHPTPAQVTKMINDNMPGLRKMLEQAPRERAATHEFTGNCEVRRLARLDRHDE